MIGRISKSYFDLDGSMHLEIELTDYDVDYLRQITPDQLLSIDIKKHRAKRSLNANAYFHLLCDKIAKKTKSTPTRVKNHLIQEAGQFELVDGKAQHLILDDDIDYLNIEWLHLYPTTKTQVLDNGKTYRVYLVRRGSHTYNTKEMAQLIDATVFEAKELGIETLTPNELERLKQAWKGGNNG